MRSMQCHFGYLSKVHQVESKPFGWREEKLVMCTAACDRHASRLKEEFTQSSSYALGMMKNKAALSIDTAACGPCWLIHTRSWRVNLSC